jgi:hypothetical protein
MTRPHPFRAARQGLSPEAIAAGWIAPGKPGRTRALSIAEFMCLAWAVQRWCRRYRSNEFVQHFEGWLSPHPAH